MKRDRGLAGEKRVEPPPWRRQRPGQRPEFVKEPATEIPGYFTSERQEKVSQVTAAGLVLPR